MSEYLIWRCTGRSVRAACARTHRWWYRRDAQHQPEEERRANDETVHACAAQHSDRPADGCAGLGSAVTASAQSNAGALTLTGIVDLPSSYVFRGLIQESDPRITVLPAVELGIHVGDAVVSLGTWHGLLAGSSGLDGPTGRLHYEERFSAGVTLPVGAGLTAGTTWTAYTSPNVLFDTRQELLLRVARRGWLNPYGVAAFELKGAADGIDDGTGSYLEVGGGPRLPLGAFNGSVTVPVKVGISLQNYYQGFSGDTRFGFLDVGAHVTRANRRWRRLRRLAPARRGGPLPAG